MNWLTPFAGIFIGWLTNVIAVEMLFRPRKPIKIFGKTIPFTPGLIPKYKNKIVTTTSEGISVVLLDALRGTGKEKAFSVFNNIVSNHWITDIFLVDFKREELYDKMVGSVLENKETQSILMDIVNQQINKYDEKEFEKTIKQLTKESLGGIKLLGGIIGGIVGIVTMLIGTLL